MIRISHDPQANARFAVTIDPNNAALKARAEAIDAARAKERQMPVIFVHTHVCVRICYRVLSCHASSQFAVCAAAVDMILYLRSVYLGISNSLYAGVAHGAQHAGR